MRKLPALLLALLLALFPAASGLAEAHSLAGFDAPEHPASLADAQFARMVEVRTDGRITVRVYAGGELYGDAFGAVEALRTGELAFARVPASVVAAYAPAIRVLQLPYLFKDSAHMWDILSGEIGQRLLMGVEEGDAELVGLCYYDAGSLSYILTRAAHAPADMAGLRLYTGDDPMAARMAELLGAMPTPDAAESDGTDGNLAAYLSTSEEMHYLCTEHVRAPEILLMGRAIRDWMNEEDMTIILQCAKEAQAYERQLWADWETQRATGARVITPTPEARAAFEAALAPMYDEYGGEYAEMVEAIRAVGAMR